MDILIHPTYFPNIAHFIALVKAENIILEIQGNYQKQTYRNRTYIYAANGKLILNIPIVHTHNTRQKYQDVKIANHENWQLQHWKSLEYAYRTSPYFEFYEDELKPLFFTKATHLLDFNLQSFEIVCHCLELKLSLSKTETYQKDYSNITDFRYLANSRKESLLQLDSYTQVFNNKCGFIGNLSILDLLFNEGPNTLLYLEAQTFKEK